MSDRRPHAVLLYHYFHPDDVVSARLFSDMAEGLTHRGWNVTAMPCQRGCHDENIARPLSETWSGGRIERVWRPNAKQSSAKGRILNAAWMLAAWGWRAIMTRRNPNEVIVIGTDPILSVIAALPWRFFRTGTRVAHWCHDLYPEAAISDGLLREQSLPMKVLKRLLAQAYRRCGLIADLGSCMGKLLKEYGSKATTATLTPWALVEPETTSAPDPVVRSRLFGDTQLGLLYSGNLGRAHNYAEFLELARLLRNTGISFCFAGRGNRADELKAAVNSEDSNVTFAGFAPEAELEARLTACDLHLVSLRPEWTGTVVPSKFFGGLAVGRGVLFVGSPDSAIAKWIVEHRVGFVATPETIPSVAAELKRLAVDPTELLAMRQRCIAVYKKHFSKEEQLNRWDEELRKLLLKKR